MSERICGHSWEQIKAAQQGDKLALRRKIIETPKPTATDKDRALLAELGKDELERAELHGVLDRLRTSGLL